jgi:WD40 repeat protein
VTTHNDFLCFGSRIRSFSPAAVHFQTCQLHQQPRAPLPPYRYIPTRLHAPLCGTSPPLLVIHSLDRIFILKDITSKQLPATMPETTKVVPLTCHGHSRPVPHIHFSSIVNDDQYYIISACKDGNPMLRDGITGDWIGTFLGHKGAVWQARLSSDASLAATASADFSAYVVPLQLHENYA